METQRFIFFLPTCDEQFKSLIVPLGEIDLGNQFQLGVLSKAY